MPRRRTYVWLAVLAGAFGFRLLFGLSSNFFSQDETQIYLLGLRYYATGAWPYFGPDVVWTNSEIPGALQALLVGVPLRLLPLPEAPFVLLNLLSTGALATFAWYIGRRLPSLPPWLIWGWLLTLPWTLQFSTHINNTSYVLPAALMFFIGFFEALASTGIGLAPVPLAHFMMGFAIVWVMQVHMSWPLLGPYAVVAWASRYRDGWRPLARHAAAFAAGVCVPALVLVPTLLRYGSSVASPGIHFHAVNPSVVLTTLARLFSFASDEIFRFVGSDNAKRLVFLESHAWLAPLAALLAMASIAQPLWMAFELFRSRTTHREWHTLKWTVAATVLLLYVADWFAIRRATEANAFYVLAPLAFMFAAYCWTFVDGPRWRRAAAIVLAVNVVFEAGLAAAQFSERSLYRHRDVVTAALLAKQPEILGHRRPYAVNPGPVMLNDPERPYDVSRDLAILSEFHRTDRRGDVRWGFSIRNTNARVAFRNLCSETTYRLTDGNTDVRHSRIDEIVEPGETRDAAVDDNVIRGDVATATVAIVFAEALLPVQAPPATVSLLLPPNRLRAGDTTTPLVNVVPRIDDACDPEAQRVETN